MKAGIEDVARRAKVSISTVSRVINKFPTVSKKNQIRVEEAVAYLKYKPNVSAQRLARGLNTAIGLVMPGYPGIFHSFYAIEIIRGIGHVCEILKLDMVFHITSGPDPINVNAVGGIVFADIIQNRKQVESAKESGIPCIVINNIVEDLDVNYVGIDNLLGGKTATEYLINLGHNKIATITGSLQTQAGVKRLEGFKKALAQGKVPEKTEYFYEGDFSRRCARIATEKFLGLKERPTAIFAASDEMALEVIAVILEKRLKVPDDISVIGFDDNPAAIYGPVALTTIKQPLFQMAEESVKFLNAVILGKKKSSLKQIIAPDLIIRDSCRSLK
ncbi:MAG: LacI family DNA-binding transcriptional regulator [Candidatus Omnitrophota bacterium]